MCRNLQLEMKNRYKSCRQILPSHSILNFFQSLASNLDLRQKHRDLDAAQERRPRDVLAFSDCDVIVVGFSRHSVTFAAAIGRCSVAVTVAVTVTSASDAVAAESDSGRGSYSGLKVSRRFSRQPEEAPGEQNLYLSLSLPLSHTQTHTHTHTKILASKYIPILESYPVLPSTDMNG